MTKNELVDNIESVITLLNDMRQYINEEGVDDLELECQFDTLQEDYRDLNDAYQTALSKCAALEKRVQETLKAPTHVVLTPMEAQAAYENQIKGMAEHIAYLTARLEDKNNDKN